MSSRLRRGLLAGAALFAACATTGVSDRQVAQLPAQDRQQLVTAQRSIDVAEQNLATARVARDEAKQFRKVAQSEVAAARSRLEAARAALELGRSARDDRALRDAQHNQDLARAQLVTARAKADYADRLITLREARIDECEDALVVARAQVELDKAHLVQRNDMVPDANVPQLEANLHDANERLAERRERVAVLQGEVAQLRTAWDDRRGEQRTAARGEYRDFAAPPAPAPLPPPPPPAVDPPRGDVNDTPAAPETRQSQPGGNGIAPAP
jgi:predicted  nucleic acid-binding Zn-ribbon protein